MPNDLAHRRASARGSPPAPSARAVVVGEDRTRPRRAGRGRRSPRSGCPSRAGRRSRARAGSRGRPTSQSPGVVGQEAHAVAGADARAAAAPRPAAAARWSSSSKVTEPRLSSCANLGAEPLARSSRGRRARCGGWRPWGTRVPSRARDPLPARSAVPDGGRLARPIHELTLNRAVLAASQARSLRCSSAATHCGVFRPPGAFAGSAPRGARASRGASGLRSRLDLGPGTLARTPPVRIVRTAC